MSHPANIAQLHSVQLVSVESKHIAEMLRRYDCGMCDITTANAISLALSEHYNDQVRVSRNHSGLLAQIGSNHYRLPLKVANWLDRIEKGLKPKPIKFPEPVNTYLAMRPSGEIAA